MNTQIPVNSVAAAEPLPEPGWQPAICPLGEDQLHEVLDFRFRMMEEAGMSPVLDADWRRTNHAFYAEQFALGLCLHHGAFVQGRLVATAGALVRTGFPYNTFKVPAGGWIMDVYVLPEYRGRGLARRLTQACIDWLGTHSHTDIRLVASRQARQLGLYEKLGFSYTNEMRLVAPR